MSSKIHNVWPVPLYETIIDIKDEWVNWVKSLDYQRMYSKNGDYTKDFYLLDQIPELKNKIIQHKDDFFYNQLGASKHIELNLENSWANQHSSGDYAQEHFHENSMLSGCVYFDVPKNSGNIEFIRPNLYNNLFTNTVSVDYEYWNNYNCRQFWIEPVRGTLLFFPSWLPHSVGENKTNEKRYSLAFNFFARGKFGNGREGQLTV